MNTATDVVSILQQIRSGPSLSVLQDKGVLLIGHSMGANIVPAVLSALSDEEVKYVKGLLLVAPAPLTPLRLPPEMRNQQKKAYESEESVCWTVENALSKTQLLSSEDMERVVHDSLAGNKLAKEAWPTYGMQEDLSSALRNSSARQDATRIQTNILVGEYDIVEPQQQFEDEVVYPLSTLGCQPALTLVKGVRHLIALEDPEAISREILSKY